MFLHIDCNSFYASCEVSLRPDLQGKPVVVANCNEAGGGIILALTKEAKALGLKRGNPVFQVKDVLNRHNVAVFAANLPKYVDISRRLMQLVKEQDILQNFTQYSVDEFFGELPIGDPKQLREYAVKVKSHIEQCTSIPVSCGISMTYTLAKVATWYAKHYAGYRGICVLPADKLDKALQGLPITDVWGVGRRLAPRMEAMGIHTAWDYSQKLAHEVKNLFKVTGLRTWRELRGEPCISIENKAQQKTIAHTRTFTYMTADLQQLQTYVSNYAVAAARKLRDQHSICREVTTFIATNPHREDLPQYSNAATIKLKVSSADARIIAKTAVEALESIYRTGFQYKRAGVILSDIDSDAYVQLDLFEESGESLSRSKKLMGVMDKINVKYGIDSLRLASQGFDKSRPNLNNFQPYKNETTDIEDIIQVK
ncbi:MAG: DUF4113 domain-containing protein [Prevotellaceae bacterium]|nr:DUF4113 domain-containing protein [Prevotellaceae bacterium]